MKDNIYNENITYDGMTNTKDGIIISSSFFNGLLKIQDNNEKVEYLGQFTGERARKKTLHHKQYEYGEKIFFMPDHSKSIHYYDLRKEKIYAVTFRNELGCEDPIRGIDSVRKGKYSWIFFAYAQNPILKFNMDTCTIEKKIFYYEKLPADVKERSIPVFNSPVYQLNNKIYAAVWKSHYIFEFDIRNETYQFINIDFDVMLTGVAALNEREFYCSIWKSGNILHAIPKENQYNSIAGPVTDEMISYCNIIHANDIYLLVPNFSNQIYFIMNNKILPFSHMPKGYLKLRDERKQWRCFFSYRVDKNEIILCPYATNMRIHIDIKNNVVSGIHNQIVHGEYEKIQKLLDKQEYEERFCGITKEVEECNLHSFLTYIIS